MYRRNRYYDSKSGRFTQEDPIGLAGGLNAYGFGEGDPVNYTDPFGLKVVVRDERLLALLQSMVRQSATFAKLWKTMVLAPGDRATFSLELDSEKGVMRFSNNTNGTGHTICGLHKCQSKINRDALSADAVVEEMIHAAGGADATTAKKAGVSMACYGSHDDPGFIAGGCNELREKINSEVDASKKKSSSGSTSP